MPLLFKRAHYTFSNQLSFFPCAPDVFLVSVSLGIGSKKKNLGAATIIPIPKQMLTTKKSLAPWQKNQLINNV